MSQETSIKKEIEELKKQRNAVILAHYYVDGDVQEIADYVGDSYYLSEVAAGVDKDVIVFAGVSFMGECAKILNPEKTVLMPDGGADCPMAHMVTPEEIAAVREKYEDVAVVTYVNSFAKIKALSDVCVTSSNALKIVKELPNKNIFFIPDHNLGGFLAKQLPEKNFIFNEGHCPTHDRIQVAEVQALKAAHPEAIALAHPECREEICKEADYVGSTKGIIDYALKSPAKEFIILTEKGIMHPLTQQAPDKRFYGLDQEIVCRDMKLITMEKVRDVLRDMPETNQVQMDDQLMQDALTPLERMLELAK
ncbi:quinolinate synthase NadA [Ohessyouella blattaphilus]|uniref:Quinolinate synthase n=1 Tax=Ohessyouella blattaphilus TaxID=2949333 RepID=A0ABT1EDS6_9FIRM|nr:quinolinate synthase NadA [Ohessyouella blattaphilus]MCP1108848.1 quinolinate synthase NadA [Ohessyouella blattaphilus]MCR8562242.1 quinolinate synthase NadA [Ohessyouella blattaphilus]